MTKDKLKVIILTQGSPVHLLNLLAALETVEIISVFAGEAKPLRRSFWQQLKRSIRYDGYWATVKKFSAKLSGGKTKGLAEVEGARENRNNFAEQVGKLNIPLYEIENFHSDEAIKQMRDANADLGILCGMNIVKDSVFSIPRLGSINIHQGLAPIYRGGPTVFWELFNGENEIGITVHFVAPKVDTGDIILQKTLPLEYDFSRYELNFENFLSDFRAGLTEPSAQLIADAVQLIAEGREQRIKQDTSLGKRYRLPTKTEKDALLRVLKKRQKKSGEINKKQFAET